LIRKQKQTIIFPTQGVIAVTVKKLTLLIYKGYVMLELRMNNDFSLIGLYETKEKCIDVMNKMIDDVLIDDALIIFDGVKLVFARQGKKVISKEKTGNTMKNLQAIQVKTLRATNTKGTRVKLVLNDRNIILPFNYEYNTSLCIAIDYVLKQGIEIIGLTSINDVNVILIDKNIIL
jgi:hypothetical protein